VADQPPTEEQLRRLKNTVMGAGYRLSELARLGDLHAGAATELASISRDLFGQVPADIKEGAIGLGLTRWEMVRGVVLPYTRGGLIAAVLLGGGRAVGEAIAVTQVIGAGHGIHWSLFVTGDTLASKLAEEYQGAVTKLQTASLVYLAAILLVISLLVNLTAQFIARRFSHERAGGS